MQATASFITGDDLQQEMGPVHQRNTPLSPAISKNLAVDELQRCLWKKLTILYPYITCLWVQWSRKTTIANITLQ